MDTWELTFSFDLKMFTDDGLDAAKRWTEVLFGNKVEVLSMMSQAELSQLFENTPTTELLFEHGLTVMDVCLKAGCFTREGT